MGLVLGSGCGQQGEQHGGENVEADLPGKRRGQRVAERLGGRSLVAKTVGGVRKEHGAERGDACGRSDLVDRGEHTAGGARVAGLRIVPTSGGAASPSPRPPMSNGIPMTHQAGFATIARSTQSSAWDTAITSDPLTSSAFPWVWASLTPAPEVTIDPTAYGRVIKPVVRAVRP